MCVYWDRKSEGGGSSGVDGVPPDGMGDISCPASAGLFITGVPAKERVA